METADNLPAPSPANIDHLRALERIGYFEDPVAVFRELASNEYDLAYEIHELVKLAKQDDSPKMKLAAIKELRALRSQILDNHGYYIRLSRQVEAPDGTTTVLSTSLVRAALSFDRRPPQPLQQNQEQNQGELSNEEDTSSTTENKDQGDGGSSLPVTHLPPASDVSLAGIAAAPAAPPAP